MRRFIWLGLVIATPFLLPLKAPAQPPGTGAVPALYATKAEAEKAARLFHCSGAHRMGDQWMPCEKHGDAHSH